MGKNIFIRPINEYKRTLTPVLDYIDQATKYLHTETGKSENECRKFVMDTIKNSKSIKNPIVTYLEKQDNGDKVEKETTLTNYIKYVLNNNKILAPSFTVYENHNIEKSLHVEFISSNIEERNKHKKLAFKYKMLGD